MIMFCLSLFARTSNELAFQLFLILLGIIGTCYGQAPDSTVAKEFYAKARKYEKQRQYDSAIIHYEEARIFYEQLNQHQSELYGYENRVNCLIGIGLCHRFLGNYATAEQQLKEAIHLGENHLGEHKVLAEAFYVLGGLYYFTGKYEPAKEAHQKGLEMRRRLFGNDHILVVNSLINIGNIVADRGDVREGIRIYEEAMAILERMDKTSTRSYAAALYNAALNYAKLREYDRAIELDQKALDIRIQLYGENHLSVANSLGSLGESYYLIGMLKKAEAYSLEAIRILENLNGSSDFYLAPHMNTLGKIYKFSGDFDKAQSYLEQALHIFSQHLGEHHRFIPSSYEELGNLYLDMYDLSKALTYYRKALELRKEIFGEYHKDVATSYANLARMYLDQKKLDSAYVYANTSRDILDKVFNGIHPDIGYTDNLIGTILRRQGKLKASINRYQQAIESYDRSLAKNHWYYAITYRNLGKVYRELGDPDSALYWYQQALNIYFPALSLTDVYLNPKKEELGSDFQIARCLNLKAGAFRMKYQETENIKDLIAAAETYALAIHFAESRHQSFTSREDQEFLNEVGFGVYQGAVQTYLDLWRLTNDHTYLDLSFETVEKSKSMTLKQGVRLANNLDFLDVPKDLISKEQEVLSQLSSYKKRLSDEKNKGAKADSSKLFAWTSKILSLGETRDSIINTLNSAHPDYFNLKYDLSTCTIKELQTSLPDSTLLIEYFEQDSSILIFGATKEKELVLTVPMDQDFQEKVMDFIRLLKGEQLSSEKEELRLFSTLGFDLYQQLLHPILSQISAPRLIIVPDSYLGYLPWDILLKEQIPHSKSFSDLPYLIKSYEVRYAYSASLFVDKRENARTYSGTYAGFAPQYSIDSSFTGPERLLDAIPSLRNGISPLFHNQEEVETAANLWEGLSFLGSKASESSFKSFGSGNQILHLAMHALLNDSLSQYSSFLFGSDSDSTEDGFLYAYELYNMRLETDLAVLSACETGLGKLNRGEGIMSLARAFKYAGCPNIVMSLWKADDQATAEIMVDFFTHLRNGLPKAAALRKAKLNYLAQAPVAASHPFYWGTFVLIGDEAPIELPVKWWPYSIICLLVLGLLVLGLLVWKWRRR
ncbi:MAG: CHAT domain-containing tetratricopeptide repeat protein [Bacteroidota bacterium]